MKFTKEDIKLLRKALKHPKPCLECDQQKYFMAACAACDKGQQWDDKFKQPLCDRGLFQLYCLLLKLNRNKKYRKELRTDIVNELGKDNICWIHDILDMV